LQFEHFSACILGGGTPAVSAADTVGNARILAALRASVHSRNPVDISASDQRTDKQNEQE
jgi:predicted dehydrogenase